jgi:ribosomal protein S18 acetylase RimI-like enzyme
VPDQVTLRRRSTADVPRLVEVLAAQQPLSRYPIRWPLPRPEEFVVRGGEIAAWVAEVGGTVVGHVALLRISPGWEADGFRAATGKPVDRLASVSVLFVDPEVGRRGVGSALLGVAVDHARATGLHPVLDVAVQHDRAVALYRRHGWSVVGEVWPEWLPEGYGPFLVMTPPDVAGPEPGLGGPRSTGQPDTTREPIRERDDE